MSAVSASRDAAPPAAPALPLPPLHRQLRWWILGLLLFATILNFVDRQALSLVAPLLRDELHLSATQYGQIVSLFMAGMVLGELPMGWVMDRFGPRRGLAFAVTSWSIANALHALGRGVVSFGALRLWLGTGECGSTSGGVKVVAQWFPQRERAFAIGVFNGGSMLGAIVAPPLIALITTAWGWPMAFVLPSSLGFVWLLLWLRFYRAPAEHPRLSPAEAAWIRDGAVATRTAAAASFDVVSESEVPSTRALLARRELWALMLCRGLVGPVVHLYLYWLPEYLFRERGLSLKEIGLYALIPFLCGDLGSIGGGWLPGRLLAAGVPLRRSRSLPLLLGAGLCLASLGVAGAGSAGLAIAAICIVLLGHTCLSANMFAAATDIFPPGAVARATALTGIAGGLSGVAFPLLTGWLVDRDAYATVFLMAAVMPLLGVATLLSLARGFRRVDLGPPALPARP
jgi:ACS family hexuronate transporter-like MFS transporter